MELTKDDLQRAAQLAELIPNGCFDKPNRRDEIALRRFSIAAAQEDDAEAIIDYVIALEGLLVPAAQGEVSFRLCLNGARYLSSEASERGHSLEAGARCWRETHKGIEREGKGSRSARTHKGRAQRVAQCGGADSGSLVLIEHAIELHAHPVALGVLTGAGLAILAVVGSRHEKAKLEPIDRQRIEPPGSLTEQSDDAILVPPARYRGNEVHRSETLLSRDW